MVFSWIFQILSSLAYSVWHIPFLKALKQTKLVENYIQTASCIIDAPTECHKNITIRVNAITYFAPRQIPLNEISSCGLSTMNE